MMQVAVTADATLIELSRAIAKVRGTEEVARDGKIISR
jgi:hypothetical protein